MAGIYRNRKADALLALVLSGADGVKVCNFEVRGSYSCTHALLWRVRGGPQCDYCLHDVLSLLACGGDP